MTRHNTMGLALVVALASLAHAQTVIYVDETATGGADNGVDWTNAFLELQSALDVATSGHEIWVAAGTYMPDYDVGTSGHTGDRTATFQLLDNVAVYGGFNGSETQLDQRDPAANQTILSGDIGTSGLDTDNSYHVVTGSGMVATAILDGFTVTGGNADGTTVLPNGSGGGMYNDGGSPTVTNCTFSGNSAEYYGGGMLNYMSSSPTVTDCTFSGNSALAGGGMFTWESSHPTVTNCTFSGNEALGALADGGGMYNHTGSNPTVTNCTFSGNSAGNLGGGMCNAIQSSPTVTNCTFSGNSAVDGGGVCNYASSPTLANCILWGNVATSGLAIYDDATSTSGVSYTCIEGGWTGPGAGPGIIATDPQFVGGGDLHLQPSSPCINAGNDVAVPPGVLTDFEGDDRIQHCRVDMGVDETPYMGDFDCNTNGVADACDIDLGTSADCNTNGIPDECDIAGSTSQDCNTNGVPDLCDIFGGTSEDCNTNGIPDECDIAAGTSQDVDTDGIPDECERVHNVTQDTIHPTIQEAIDAAVGGDEIEVGPGTYVERINLLGKAITLRSTDGPTVTAMDAGAAGSVITCESGEGPDTVIEGFTVTNGHVVGGSGMYNYGASPTVTNCVFSGCSGEYLGGGMHNEYGSSPTVTDCIFSGNSAGNGGGMYDVNFSDPKVTSCTFSGNSASVGGGMCNSLACNPTVTNCTFSGNSATGGGGMYNEISNPTVTNCTFSGNSAEYRGGGMRHAGGSPTLANCTFTGNSAGEWGGGICNLTEGGGPTLANCIIWGNTALTGPQIYDYPGSVTTVTYSCIAGGWSGAGNIDAHPYLDSALRLAAGSPCIDAGDNTAVPADTPDLDGDGDTAEPIPLDLFGLQRFFDDPTTTDTGVPGPPGPIVDMGACEHGSTPPAPTLPGDLDNDGDVDLDDFALLAQQLTGPEQAQTVIYVDATATGGGDTGVDWTNAFLELQSALDVASSGHEIWVAAGTYLPDYDVGTGVHTGDRTATFQLLDNVGVYGGFNGTETQLDQRDPAANETILSGDIGTSGVDTDNSYHVVTGSGTDATAVLDGFTISGGNAVGASHQSCGGGMFNEAGSPTLTNCTFSGNSAEYAGGGMYNADNSPTVTNCTFSGNSAGEWGGGMSNYGASPTVTNCTFSGNSSSGPTWVGGGGMSNSTGSRPTVTSCTFSGNSANNDGGGMLNEFGSSLTVTNCTFSGNWANDGGGMYSREYSNPTVTNCTFSGNWAGKGGGMHTEYTSSPTVTNCTFSGNSAGEWGGGICNFTVGGGPTLANCILWGNTAPTGPQIYDEGPSSVTTVTYSCIAGGWSGTGNIDAHPYLDSALRLVAGSPCIDAGDNTAVPPDTPDLDDDGDTAERIPLDFFGLLRFHDDPLTTDTGVGAPPIVDMGACEYGSTPPPLPMRPGDLDSDGDVDLADFALFSQQFSGLQ